VAVIGDVLMQYTANGHEPERLGNRSRCGAPHGCYRCRGEDRWVAIAVMCDAEWARFCGIIGQPGLVTDARFATAAARVTRAEELDSIVDAWTSGRDAYDVMATLQAAGIAAGVVQTVEDGFERDPHVRARGFFEEIDHVRKGTVVATGIPLGLTGTPGHTAGAGAAIGADNAYVFGELLGLSSAEIEQYRTEGAIEADEPTASR